MLTFKSQLAKSSLRLACLLVTGLIAAQSASGWARTEHEVVAWIAWAQLPVETRARVTEMMKAAPKDSGIMALYPEDPVNAPLIFFLRASTWVDAVRDRSHPEYSKYNCPFWHYAEMPFAEPGATIPDIPAFQPWRVNVVERLGYFQKTLVDNDEPEQNRAIETVWILHLIGDIHQPLHVASRVTKLEPEGDAGGNRFRLRPASGTGTSNLHAYWDMILSRNFPRSGGETELAYIERLAKQVMKQHPKEKLAGQLNSGNPETWAAESFALAKTVVYSNSLKRNEEPSAEYKRQAMETAGQRIALAGYRLADMLNKIYGPNRIDTRVATSDSKNIKARLDYDLACVSSTLNEKTRALAVIRGMVAEGQAAQGQTADGFDPQQVTTIGKEIRQALLETLSRDELSGLRAYAERKFPEAALNIVRITGEHRFTDVAPGADPTPEDLLRSHARGVLPFATDIATTKSVNSYFESLRNLISGIRRNSGPITLRILSQPDGANIILKAPGNKQYVRSTNSEITDFWRGTYTITVSRDGFVTIVQPNQDVGFESSVVDCQLVTSGAPIVCKIH